MKNQNKFYSLALITIITNLIGVVYLGTNQYVSILKIILLIICIFCVFKISVVCFKWYMEYALNLKTTFDSKVDKPRVFFISLFVPLMIFSLYLISIYKESTSFHGDFSTINIIMDVSYISIFLLLFMVTGYLMFYLFKPSFAELYLPKIKSKASNFLSKRKDLISYKQAEFLFDNMIKHGFIIYEDLSNQTEMKSKFIEVLQKGLVLESPLFDLKMTNIQTKLFQDQLKSINKKYTLRFVLSVFTIKGRIAIPKNVSSSYDGRKVEIVSRENDIISLFKV